MTHELDQVASKHRGGQTCILDKILDRLADDDRLAVCRAVRDTERVSHRVIADWLTENGHPISVGAIKNFRDRKRLTGYLAGRGITL